MTAVIDHEIERVARNLWPAPLRMENAAGGLFNRVVRVESPEGTKYLKRFTDVASSGDFPPLPTSAAQRCLVASSWHELAMRASTREPRVGVPPLLAVQTELDVVAMDHAHGAPLYDMLVAGDPGADDALGPMMAWLAALHALPLEPREALAPASARFKAFKIDLQYTRVLPEIPAVLHPAAQAFVAAYLQSDREPVHGDLNSRNVLVAGGAVSAIDFEQGHFGEGVYDVAYLLSEYVIGGLRAARDPEATIRGAWASYEHARGAADEQAWRRLRVHTAFQTLYRLVGPSRKVWTGHLDDDAKQAVRRWSVEQLGAWLR